jgi:phosphatidylserine/phosphatidylglycerophosphate/cardiolipin synthase-like enzyme
MLRLSTLAVLATHAILVSDVLSFTACGTPPPAAPATRPAPPRRPTSPPPAPFELVETAPIETMLDHAELRDAGGTWLDMIGDAQTSIDLAQFYAANHQPSRLEPVIEALEAAAARGVHIRFLAEHSFVKVYPDTLARLALAGAEIRHFDLTSSTGGILHAKYFVVDDREAFFGSQNFDWRALEHNSELGARVHDPAIVDGIAAIFAADWARAGNEAPPNLPAPPPDGPFTLVASPPSLLPAGIPWDLPRLVALLDSATETITVELLTYRAETNEGPWDELEAPLVRAAHRGVHVQLLLSDWAKRAVTIGGIQRLARVPNIAIRLTTIPPWSGGFLPFARVAHAKALVVDGKRAWLGTSNWEKDYFYKSRNLGVIIDAPSIAAQLAGFFATLWRSPYATPVDPNALYTPPQIE